MFFMVRPTPSGAVLLAVALAAGIVGSLRQELGSLLWGAAFLGLGLYALLAVLMVSFRLRSFLAALPSIPLCFDGETGYPGTPLTTSWTLPLPVRLFPGVFLQGEVRAIRPGWEISAMTLLGPGKTAAITLKNPLRGKYQTRMIVHCRDALGLFHATLPVQGEGRLTIYPPVVPPRSGRELPSLGGTGPAEQRSHRRSEELFDLRKYQTGDDPRRIHWKLFAHLEELFIRQGEEEPPPSGEFPVFFDLTHFGGVTPYQDTSEEYLDQFLGRFALWGQEILGKGGTLSLYGAGVPGQFRAGQEEGLLAFLAGLGFQRVPGEDLPEETRRFYYLVTPYSVDWAPRFHRLQDKSPGRTGCLLIPSPRIEDGPPYKGGLIKRLLFCPGEGEILAEQQKELSLRFNLLQGEAAKVSSRGGVHVL